MNSNAPMSPRIIHMPLSGGDRKHYARELRRAETLHGSLVERVAEARRVTIEHRRMTRRLMCEEWSVRQFIGGDLEPSPTIAAALDADCVLLLAECRACGGSNRFDLRDVIWSRHEPIHTLGKVLACRQCEKKGRLNFTGLQTLEPDADPPKAAARRR